MIQPRRSVVLALLLLSVSGPAPASESGQSPAAARLERFVRETEAATGEFAQKNLDREGNLTGESKGRFEFLRPGKFVWRYTEPYEQEIVSNGTKLWIYDRDLNQVLEKSLGGSLHSTPAAILFGDADFSSGWTIGVDQNGRTLARPREAAGFDEVSILWGRTFPEKVTFLDSFGQSTEITFSSVVLEKLSADRFEFVPPEGADVLSGLE